MKKRNKTMLPILLLLVLLWLSSTSTAWAEDTYKAQVNQNARIDVQITDSEGRAVAPGREIDSIRYVIKSKPENAKVSVYTLQDSELQNTGHFTIAFTCNMEGTVELQSFVMMKDAAKFYTGTHTIEVTEPKQDATKTVILSIGSSQMIVDHDVVKTDAAPFIQNNRTYVPLRALCDIFDVACSYDTVTQQITIQNKETTIVMAIGADQYHLNDTIYTMDAPAFLTEHGRTMVPLRFMANAFGAVMKLTYQEDGTVADIMLQL